MHNHSEGFAINQADFKILKIKVINQYGQAQLMQFNANDILDALQLVTWLNMFTTHGSWTPNNREC